LCPHLRINPETKLVTPLGINLIFWWLFVFFCGHLLRFHISLVLSVSESSGYPERPSGSISICPFCLHFLNFCHLHDFSHYVQLQPARTGQVCTLHIGSSANTSHLASMWPARILSSRTVLHCLPASKIF
jgi:hypothetical protein